MAVLCGLQNAQCNNKTIRISPSLDKQKPGCFRADILVPSISSADRDRFGWTKSQGKISHPHLLGSVEMESPSFQTDFCFSHLSINDGESFAQTPLADITIVSE